MKSTEIKASAALIEERLPVWVALSDFFLDEDLTSECLQYIASTLAKSPYSMSDLEGILENEVYPVCYINKFSVAGVWGTFGEDWIKERIAPRLEKRRRLGVLGIPPIHRWMYRDHWKTVKNLIQEIRKKPS